jgi:hypothetical protein
MNLSLAPRFDQFRFMIPKEYIPPEVLNKYDKILAKNPSIFMNAIDYLNESIKGISLPAIENLIVEQPQVSHNSIREKGELHGRINIEPSHTNVTLSSENILSKINNTFTVTFRQNQGLYNYFMIYESIFHRYMKPELYHQNDTEMFDVVFLDEDSLPVSRMMLYQPEFNGISGLEFAYDKVERQTDTFDVVFTFNDIDFDFFPRK